MNMYTTDIDVYHYCYTVVVVHSYFISNGPSKISVIITILLKWFRERCPCASCPSLVFSCGLCRYIRRRRVRLDQTARCRYILVISEIKKDFSDCKI